ncbi:hypothetical protein [Mucilaginibacter sp. HD30]
MKRFQDENLRLSYFDDEVLVACPKCTKRAIITKEKPNFYFSKRILKCPNCFFQQDGRKESFTVELNCHCANCAAEIKVSLQNVKEKKDKIAVRCNNCGETEAYEPRNIEQKWMYQNAGQPSDSYFGLPLWLTQNFRGNNFWAYNYRHLDYLKQYIAADLREKNARQGWTMVEKLPAWMKSAKNRNKLSKLYRTLS